MTNPVFFSAPAEFRKWLEEHHDKKQELLVGFYKKGSGKPSLTWPESVDQALCFGWIDGIRRSVDEVSYSIRFTPRKTSSTWSTVNIDRVNELTKLDLMRPAGLKAFSERQEKRSGIYAYEQKEVAQLDEAHQQQFEANQKAWNFFQTQAPWYQRTVTWWVVSAKKEETKLKRLATLIEVSEKGQTVAGLTRPTRKVEGPKDEG